MPQILILVKTIRIKLQEILAMTPFMGAAILYSLRNRNQTAGSRTRTECADL